MAGVLIASKDKLDAWIVVKCYSDECGSDAISQAPRIRVFVNSDAAYAYKKRKMLELRENGANWINEEGYIDWDDAPEDVEYYVVFNAVIGD